MLILFLLILMTQMLSYALVDYIKIKNGRFFILLIFLLIYFLILPNFYPVPKENVNSILCYYNPFEYLETFWVLGIALIILAHLIYCQLLKRKTNL
jgi:hypothetical protein